jgi:hypothetical protein
VTGVIRLYDADLCYYSTSDFEQQLGKMTKTTDAHKNWGNPRPAAALSEPYPGCACRDTWTLAHSPQTRPDYQL